MLSIGKSIQLGNPGVLNISAELNNITIEYTSLEFVIALYKYCNRYVVKLPIISSQRESTRMSISLKTVTVDDLKSFINSCDHMNISKSNVDELVAAFKQRRIADWTVYLAYHSIKLSFVLKVACFLIDIDRRTNNPITAARLLKCLKDDNSNNITVNRKSASTLFSIEELGIGIIAKNRTMLDDTIDYLFPTTARRGVVPSVVSSGRGKRDSKSIDVTVGVVKKRKHHPNDNSITTSSSSGYGSTGNTAVIGDDTTDAINSISNKNMINTINSSNIDYNKTYNNTVSSEILTMELMQYRDEILSLKNTIRVLEAENKILHGALTSAKDAVATTIVSAHTDIGKLKSSR